jgi:hypothetical protein
MEAESLYELGKCVEELIFMPIPIPRVFNRIGKLKGQGASPCSTVFFFLRYFHLKSESSHTFEKSRQRNGLTRQKVAAKAKIFEIESQKTI